MTNPVNRNSIKRTYSNLIDDIESEEVRNKLLDDLEEIDDLIILLEGHIEEELEAQEADYCPSQSEMFRDFEACRKEMMLQ